MTNNFPTVVAAMAGFLLFTVAIPGPIMLDLLGAGIASLGLGMICDRA
ncbi:MAG: hypothetical protein ACRYG8_14810 [Janthinobacterium lividum]